MKRIVTTLVTGVLALYCHAQNTSLSGRVLHVKNAEIRLELLVGDDVLEKPAILLPLSADGRFSYRTSLTYPVFAMLTTGKHQQRLLLSPGRKLQVNIDSINKVRFLFAGQAAPENKILQAQGLDSLPFFSRAKWSESLKAYQETVPYSKVQPDNWQSLIMSPVEKEFSDGATIIEKTVIPVELKKALHSELKYHWQCAVVDFTRNYLRFSKNPNRDTLQKLAFAWQPLPDSAALRYGPNANKILGWYAYEIFKKKTKPSKGQTNKQVVAAFLQSDTATLDSLFKLYGSDAVLYNLFIKRYLPASLQDKMLLNLVHHQVHFASLATAKWQLQQLKEGYPHSPYLALANKEVQEMELAINRIKNNEKILYKNGSKSLADLVAPHKGKIVYLDIWGTWCGPCREEIPYAKELRKKYAAKEIVFVYLDMDSDAQDDYWKNFIKQQGMEGEHHRMTSEAIEPVWQELQAAGTLQIHTYPAFIIFDKNGKIVQPNAERPSSKEKLYAQLDKLL